MVMTFAYVFHTSNVITITGQRLYEIMSIRYFSIKPAKLSLAELRKKKSYLKKNHLKGNNKGKNFILIGISFLKTTKYLFFYYQGGKKKS